MKLSIVFPVMNQFPLARVAIENAIKNLSKDSDAELIVIDNGSDKPFMQADELGRFPGMQFLPPSRQIMISHDKSIGVYPTFWDALRVANGDYIAYFHSDMIVSEKDWDLRVIEQFEKKVSLGLLGFIGSNQIDSCGGRGNGTTSNFQGDEYTESDGAGEKKTWKGSPGFAHGKQSSGFSEAAVVDGCAMIFRRGALEAIPQRESFPPHHFYDRLLSCEVREKGYTMGVLGIACDHISGQTVNQEPKYDEMAREWAEAHGFTMEGAHNWDTVLYREAEKQWLNEYRDIKHLVPCTI